MFSRILAFENMHADYWSMIVQYEYIIQISIIHQTSALYNIPLQNTAKYVFHLKG